MSKVHRKQASKSDFYDYDENAGHHYKVRKSLQQKKLNKNVDRVLRSKDITKFKSEDYYLDT